MISCPSYTVGGGVRKGLRISVLRICHLPPSHTRTPWQPPHLLPPPLLLSSTLTGSETLSLQHLQSCALCCLLGMDSSTCLQRCCEHSGRFIHSFSKDLSSTYCVKGPDLGAGETATNRQSRYNALGVREEYSNRKGSLLWGERK